MHRLGFFAIAGLLVAAPTLAHAEDTAHAVVHVESKTSVDLEERGTDGLWSVACTAPCDTALALGMSYRVGGSGTRHSRPFVLSPTLAGPIRLQVSRAPTSEFVGGAILLGTGALTAGIGAALTLVGALRTPLLHGDVGAVDPTAKPLLMAGFVAFGVGAIVALVGALLVGANARSSVRIAFDEEPAVVTF